MAKADIHVILQRIAVATKTSPIIVYRTTRLDGTSYLSAAFAATVQAYRDIRYPPLAREVIGCFDRDSPKNDVRQLLTEASHATQQI